MKLIDPNKPRRENQRRFLQSKGWEAVWALKDNGSWIWKWIHPSFKKAYSRNDAVKIARRQK